MRILATALLLTSILAGCNTNSSPSSPSPSPASANGSGTIPTIGTAATTGTTAVPTIGTPATGVAGTSTGTAALTYTNTIATMMSSYCVSCHGVGGNPPVLNTYALVQANAQAITSAMATNMPTTGLLPAATTQQFQSWITAGMPQ